MLEVPGGAADRHVLGVLLGPVRRPLLAQAFGRHPVLSAGVVQCQVHVGQALRLKAPAVQDAVDDRLRERDAVCRPQQGVARADAAVAVDAVEVPEVWVCGEVAMARELRGDGGAVGDA